MYDFENWNHQQPTSPISSPNLRRPHSIFGPYAQAESDPSVAPHHLGKLRMYRSGPTPGHNLSYLISKHSQTYERNIGTLVLSLTRLTIQSIKQATELCQTMASSSSNCRQSLTISQYQLRLSNSQAMEWVHQRLKQLARLEPPNGQDDKAVQPNKQIKGHGDRQAKNHY